MFCHLSKCINEILIFTLVNQTMTRAVLESPLLYVPRLLLELFLLHPMKVDFPRVIHVQQP